ncbi:unnamed protein product [Acanthosepion pharaonis]|uniref:Uncharacterized protein n=1 Tax=Acanthosepion pharaonis TaxID=158019 RepID=A0A812E033_ACAPH|nr:unnamed protein product [Sepia pharaonis]
MAVGRREGKGGRNGSRPQQCSLAVVTASDKAAAAAYSTVVIPLIPRLCISSFFFFLKPISTLSFLLAPYPRCCILPIPPPVLFSVLSFYSLLFFSPLFCLLSLLTFFPSFFSSFRLVFFLFFFSFFYSLLFVLFYYNTFFFSPSSILHSLSLFLLHLFLSMHPFLFSFPPYPPATFSQPSLYGTPSLLFYSFHAPFLFSLTFLLTAFLTNTAASQFFLVYFIPAISCDHDLLHVTTVNFLSTTSYSSFLSSARPENA